MPVRRQEKRARTQRSQRAANVTDSVGVTDDHIRNRAYEIYLSREERAGDAMSDWLQAERELFESKDTT